MVDEKKTIQELLEIPWLGLRPDLVLHPGPVDFDGQRSWILEDPVRGNNFRLGHAEGELIYRLNTEPNVDSAVTKLYQNTTLRPTIEEIVGFVNMLQKESLAVLPEDEVIRRESSDKNPTAPGFMQQILKGNIFFRIPLLRPDTFLAKTLPWLSLLWSPFLKAVYLICGIAGLILTLQEIELYLGTVNYLFTPQGGIAFLICLALLKTGHEFAHAYTAKSLGLHVRSMGIMLIVVWPLLYTDTTDVWKVPNRRQRMRVSAAGVLFELTIAGIALLLWALLPDGIMRSLMFFLSGTSLISSVLINLNPFMRYDGYYLLMDMWGIDNLRPRASAMYQHALRRLLFDWKGPAPEIHPHRQSLIIYGFLAGLYRIFIGISIAVSVYYLFFPVLGLLIFAAEMWLFIIYPLWIQIITIVKNRKYLGSKFRIALTGLCFLTLIAALMLPIPQIKHVPCLLLFKGADRVETPDAGRIVSEMPEQGREVSAGELITSINSEALEYERQQIKFDIESVRASIRGLGSGGEQGAYRKWLMVEEERLKVSLEKYNQALAQLEIRSPINGRIMDVNQDIYKGAFVPKGAWLFTIAAPDSHELKAFVHEKIMSEIIENEGLNARVRFSGPEIPDMEAFLTEKSVFPVHRLPNNSLLDIAGGPIVSVQDLSGIRPRDAYFTFTFQVEKVPSGVFHGMPAWIWIQSKSRSFAKYITAQIWKKIIERGFF